MKFKSQLQTIILLFFSISIHAQSRNATNYGKIDSFLNYLFQNDQFMGSVAININGSNVFDKAYGFSALSNRSFISADTETKYRIGSVSKSFTAVMIMQLQEEKKLNINDKLSKYFKEIPNADKISLKQMLLHRSGLHNYTENPYWSKIDTFVSEKEWLERLSKQSSDFEPGSKMEYSNTNYLLLGYIIEKVSQQSYNENLQKRICNKIGLKNTYLPKENALAGQNEAISFALQEGKWNKVDETHVSSASGAGGIISTSADLNQFWEALFNYKLVNKTSLKDMLPEKDNALSKLNEYGYGMFSMPFDSLTAFGHGGRIDNFSTTSAYFPNEKIAFTICDNGTVMPINDIVIGLLSMLFNKPYDFPNFSNEITLSTTEMEGLVGSYENEVIGMKLKFFIKENKLFAQASGQNSFPLAALSADTFQFKQAGITLYFKRDSSGKGLSVALKQSGGEYEFKRIEIQEVKKESFILTAEELSKFEGVYSSTELPIKITITKSANGLSAEATGQGSIELQAESETTFSNEDFDVTIVFKKDATEKIKGFTLKQGGDIEFTKE